MMANCRKTCKEWIQNLNDSQIPEEIKNLGGYEDVISDRFGNRFDTCDLGRMKLSLQFHLNFIINKTKHIDTYMQSNWSKDLN